MNLPVPSPKHWWDWLAENHAAETEVWLHLFKKASGTPSVTWEQAVVEALCWGWIDGQAKSLDADSWLQRFTPRRPRSNWSQRNRDHAERLIAEGRMQPPGLAHVTAAKADGRWDTAYAGPASAEIPADFLEALAQSAQATATYETLNAQNRYAIYHRLITAKRPETRIKRIADFIAMLARGERFHP